MKKFLVVIVAVGLVLGLSGIASAYTEVEMSHYISKGWSNFNKVKLLNVEFDAGGIPIDGIIVEKHFSGYGEINLYEHTIKADPVRINDFWCELRFSAPLATQALSAAMVPKYDALPDANTGLTPLVLEYELLTVEAVTVVDVDFIKTATVLESPSIVNYGEHLVTDFHAAIPEKDVTFVSGDELLPGGWWQHALPTVLTDKEFYYEEILYVEVP